jgi:prepilin-type N-terminal cleavage/methylation domain-containing protein
MRLPARSDGFTLIELVVVILIIATLAALLVPAASRTIDRAKNAQAKNDVTQIVTAVNAYYTEYGKYPTTQTTDANAIFTTDNSAVINALRAANGDTLNTRKIVFLSPRQIVNGTKGGVADTPSSGNAGIYYDPWGKSSNAALTGSGVYHIAIDANYDNQIDTNPYGNNNGAGPQPLQQGVIVWSLGKDGGLGKVSASNPTGNNIFTGSDDIISWQ